MVALRGGILDAGRAHAQDLLLHLGVIKNRGAEISPIGLPAAINDVVDGGQGQGGMVQVAVFHARESSTAWVSVASWPAVRVVPRLFLWATSVYSS